MKLSRTQALQLLNKCNIQRKSIYNKQLMENMTNQATHTKSLHPLSQNSAFILKIQRQDDYDQWIYSYEKGEAYEAHYGEDYGVSLVLDSLNIKQAPEAQVQQLAQQPVAPKEHRRSRFHNFQKNLIRLLKRVIAIKKKELISLPYGLEAYQLWRCFINEASNCKRSLQIVFGAKFKEKQQLLQEVTSLRSIQSKSLSKHGIKALEESQRLLRKFVHHKATQVEKDVIQKSTKVKNFQGFYSYFLLFLKELQEGEMPLRMAKEQRTKNVTQQQLN